tara:strand:- start:55 stop:393 length:339 start_codon:yes stop_codon:yes gene_type:complete
MKIILLITVLIGIPALIIIDSVLIKWIRIKVNGDQISVRKLFRFQKFYNLSTDLNSWKRIQGYSRFGGNGYLLILRFNNHDFYQIDSSYGLRQYEEIYRELNLKYKDLNVNT